MLLTAPPPGSIAPQKGFQELVLTSRADIAFVGGSAGGGKTWLLLVEAARNITTPGFGGVIFRRTMPQVANPGGLWDTSQTLYPLLGGYGKDSVKEWVFDKGTRIKFAHLEHEKNKLDWQGSQIPFIGFDEVTHFTEGQFWYLVSRNRSACGVRPYIRATCNPDPLSWVARLVEWWIDPISGFPIPERNGVLRYFTRDGENLVWGDTVEEVVAQCPHIFDNPNLQISGVGMERLVKSFTFISGNIYDNQLFIAADPSYLGNLLSLRPEEKARLLGGNWKISLDGLMLCDPQAITSIFTNYPEQAKEPVRVITCDAARFGRDLCVILVWKGWEIVQTIIIKKSDVHRVVQIIEAMRAQFSVPKHRVIVDQSGVGGGTVALGGYTGFNGGAAALKDQETRKVENYEHLKTQCYYRFCERRINTGQFRWSISSENCIIYDDVNITPSRTTKIMLAGRLLDVRDLIQADFRSCKRRETANEGTDKIKFITKEEQKNALGRSPDFADAAMMREYIELLPKTTGMRQVN